MIAGRRARSACWTIAALAVLLAGCAGAPRRDAPVEGADGGASTPPAGGPRVSPYAPAQEDPSTRGDYVAGGLYKPGVADSTPDYVPDVDAIPEPEVVALPRSRYGNGPTYKVLGRTYRVLDDTEGFVETGLASYYGQKFHGRRTSNQEVYDMYAFTAAHKSLPLPSFARVTNLDTGQSVVVRVNDRGPFHEGRVVDLSYAAAVKIGVHPRGTARVEVRALAPGEDARHVPADTRVAAVAAATAVAAAGMQAPAQASAAQPSPASPAPATDGEWRFDMHQDGRAMTADEFDAWMKSRRARVATGRAGTPDPRGPAEGAAAPVAAASTPATASGPGAPLPAAEALAAPGVASPTAVAAPAVASPGAAAAGGVLLQVAAFGSRDNAERALALLRGAGIDGARLHDGAGPDRPLWRLRVGPVAPALVQELSARVAGLGFGAPHPVRE